MLVVPFQLHKILVPQIPEHVRIHVPVLRAGQVFKNIVSLQWNDLGGIDPPSKTDPQMVQKTVLCDLGTGPQGAEKKETED
jgi:hypothetical protein